MLLLFYINFILAKNIDHDSETIACLINQVRYSEATFIRNGSKHFPRDAANHIQMKYRKAIDSGWPFYEKRKISAQMFIDKVASTSSFSGKPYKIEVGNKVYLVKEWLKKKLKKNCRTLQQHQ